MAMIPSLSLPASTHTVCKIPRYLPDIFFQGILYLLQRHYTSKQI